MKLFEKINKSTDPGIRRVLLGQAIKEKIESLENDVNELPGLFFKLPSIASKQDKEAKIDALKNLQVRILVDARQGNFCSYSNKVLDGDTLKLFKLAARIYLARFSAEEKTYFATGNRGPAMVRK